MGLLIQLDGRVAQHESQRINEFIEVGEFGVALEWFADVLAERSVPLIRSAR